MKSNWQTKTLGEVCNLDTARNTSNGLPYVGMEDIESGTGRFLGSLDAKKVKGGSFSFTPKHLLYGRLRPYLNKVMMPNFTGHCSTEVFPIRVKDELDRKFLFYWITGESIVKLIDATCTGARMPRANLKEVLDFSLPVPPLPEQRRIVAILDDVFERVAKAKANAEKNLANAREILDSYLDTVFGIPNEKWVSKRLGELCNFVRGPFGGSLKKSIFKPSGYAVYEQQHAIYDQFDQIRYFIDAQKFAEMKRFELKSGELIMSCSGTMGKVAIVPNDIKPGIINQALLKLSPSRQLSNSFLKLWMESKNFQDSLRAFSQGAAIQNVASVKILKEIKVSIPSILEQDRIVKHVDALSTETKQLEAIYRQKLSSLEELKKSVLRSAFSGQL